tara:strand:+ start:6455 stop:6814 length:360 start_codon:yes stop_codon:yes gene_type:complete
MKNEDEDATIIPFPINRIKEERLTEQIALSEEGAYDLIIAVSSINMATKYKGAFDENCKQNLKADNFPCTENCGCYLHMLSSMALEVVVNGPRKDEARAALHNEYSTLQKEGPKRKDNG